MLIRLICRKKKYFFFYSKDYESDKFILYLKLHCPITIVEVVDNLGAIPTIAIKFKYIILKIRLDLYIITTSVQL